MEQEEDWDGISDSELLEIQSEHFCSEESFQTPSTSATCRDTQNKSSISLTQSASLLTTEEQLKQNPVKRHEETGVKRKRDTEDSCDLPLRFGKLHLNVSLLSEQTWCEKKVVYGFLKPQIKKKDKQRIEVQTGASIHLARELEVHDLVAVNIQTHEDAVAVSLLNMLNMIPRLEAGQCVREFPVFGIVEGVHLKGIIDELSYNQKGELVLKELKTRKQDSLPGAAQALGHRFQVALYKLLFDALVRGEVKKEQILRRLKLKGFLPLGAELEYCHQSSSSFIGTVLVQFDENQLRADLREYLQYWRGHREPKGVDIEEAWKCTSCVYEEICDWRPSTYQVTESLHTTKRVNMN